MDVNSLYTNIPSDVGIRAARKILNKHRTEPNVKPTNSSIIKLLELVLKRNNFQFNGQNYLQIGGTSTSTKTAPSFACHTMGDFEETFVYTYDKQPILYLRFIDDIFMIWQHDMPSLLDFIHHINTRMENITFTHEISQDKVSFLDTWVILQHNTIVTDLYSKPTDSHNYLRYESAHPQRCKDSIPYSQFLRIRRICSELMRFDTHVLTLTPHFLRRNYPLTLLQEAALLARSKDRQELLHPANDTGMIKENEKVFLITTYHPHDHQLRQTIYKNWDMLGRSPTTEFLHTKKLVCGYRRPKNLRDLLVRATLPPKLEDLEADPEHTGLPQHTLIATTSATQQIAKKQSSIKDFFVRNSSDSQ